MVKTIRFLLTLGELFVIGSGSGASQNIHKVPADASVVVDTVRYSAQYLLTSPAGYRVFCSLAKSIRCDRRKLKASLAKSGIQYLEPTYVTAENRSKYPPLFVYALLEEYIMLNPKRVRVTVDVITDGAEAFGKIYLDEVRGRWMINGHDTKIQVGE